MARAEAFPEYRNWRDTGCSVAPRCLECPLEVCRYDVTDDARTARNRDRDGAILARLNDGATVDDIAQEFGISRRSVFRVQQVARRSAARWTRAR